MEANAAVTQRQNSEVACVFMRCSSVDTGVAASLGFEPRQRDSESLVLPLHYEATSEKSKDRCASLQVESSCSRG